MAMEIAAWLASALVFTTFFMKTMVGLRIVAITSNVAFIAYALLGVPSGIFDKVLPILVLHSLLLPLNLMRLREMKGRATVAAARRGGTSIWHARSSKRRGQACRHGPAAGWPCRIGVFLKAPAPATPQPHDC